MIEVDKQFERIFKGNTFYANYVQTQGYCNNLGFYVMKGGTHICFPENKNYLRRIRHWFKTISKITGDKKIS